MHTARMRGWFGLLMVWCALGSGCLHMPRATPLPPPPPDGTVPRELVKQTLPPYVIEPPDILQIDVLVPPDRDEPTKAFSTALPPQPIGGQHLVRPDGTIGLGVYGSVQVAGLTLDQARERIAEFIREVRNLKREGIQVSVDVAAYNSKVYYVITDGAGYGEQVYAFPIVGSETVLDALARIGGIPAVGSKKEIWVARRCPSPGYPDQILPVNWCAITREGIATTNYQVLPGDRVFVQAERIFSIDNALAKFFAPIERVFGVVLLGSSTVNSINGRFGNSGNNN